MPPQDRAVLVTGHSSLERDALIRRLKDAGCRVLDGSETETPSHFIHVWAPGPKVELREPAAAWYEAAVARPVLLAAKAAPSLSHLCLVATEDASVPRRVLEDALSYLARRHKLPFEVLPPSGYRLP